MHSADLVLSLGKELARLRRTVCAATRGLLDAMRDLQNHCFPPHSQSALRIVALTHSLNTQIALHGAAFHENWELSFASSPKHAVELLRSLQPAAFVYDYESGYGDWRYLCCVSTGNSVRFHLVAMSPRDDLFLSVVAAGGSSVSWKPLSSEQIISAIQCAHTTREEQLARSANLDE